MDSKLSLAEQEQLDRDLEWKRMHEEIDRLMALAYTHITKYPIIYLFVTFLFFQIILLLLVVFNSFVREDLVVLLHGLRTRRARLVVRCFYGILVVGVAHNVYKAVNVGDHVVFVVDILEASLMGFVLFLLLMINNLHHYEYIKEAVELEKNIRDEMTRKYYIYIRSCDNAKKNEVEANRMTEEISQLKIKISNLQRICYMKEEQVKFELDKLKGDENKIEGILAESNRVETCNEDIRDQMRDINERLSQGYEAECYLYDSLFECGCRKRVGFSWDQWGSLHLTV